MSGNAKLFIALGALAALAGVVLGAFGAHALKSQLAGEMLEVWRTAVAHHMYHPLGLLLIGVLALRLPESTLLRWAGALMAPASCCSRAVCMRLR